MWRNKEKENSIFYSSATITVQTLARLIGLMVVRTADKSQCRIRPWVDFIRRKQSLLNKSTLLPAYRKYFFCSRQFLNLIAQNNYRFSTSLFNVNITNVTMSILVLKSRFVNCFWLNKVKMHARVYIYLKVCNNIQCMYVHVKICFSRNMCAQLILQAFLYFHIFTRVS